MRISPFRSTTCALTSSASLRSVIYSAQSTQYLKKPTSRCKRQQKANPLVFLQTRDLRPQLIGLAARLAPGQLQQRARLLLQHTLVALQLLGFRFFLPAKLVVLSFKIGDRVSRLCCVREQQHVINPLFFRSCHVMLMSQHALVALQLLGFHLLRPAENGGIECRSTKNVQTLC